MNMRTHNILEHLIMKFAEKVLYTHYSGIGTIIEENHTVTRKLSTVYVKSNRYIKISSYNGHIESLIIDNMHRPFDHQTCCFLLYNTVINIENNNLPSHSF